MDADHITLETVDRYLAPSDFFTIDVAAFIGKPADPAGVIAFLDRHGEFAGSSAAETAAKYFSAVKEAGRIYRRIAAAKGEGERSSPRSPWMRPTRRRRRRNC